MDTLPLELVWMILEEHEKILQKKNRLNQFLNSHLRSRRLMLYIRMRKNAIFGDLIIERYFDYKRFNELMQECMQCKIGVGMKGGLAVNMKLIDYDRFPVRIVYEVYYQDGFEKIQIE